MCGDLVWKLNKLQVWKIIKTYMELKMNKNLTKIILRTGSVFAVLVMLSGCDLTTCFGANCISLIDFDESLTLFF